MVTLSVSVEPEIAEYLEYYASENNTSRNAAHRQILIEWYEKKKMAWLEHKDE